MVNIDNALFIHAIVLRHVETVVCLSREKADESEKESNMISDERSKYKS